METGQLVTDVERCVTCARELATPYCPECGERRASDRAYSLKEFGHELLEAFLSFDGRAIRTFKTLVRHPGELTAAYMRGKRLPYLAPLQCFLVFNLLYFAWAVATHDHVFDTPLSVQVSEDGMPYAATANRAVVRHLARTGQTMKAYEQTFDTVGTAQAKSLVIVMVPAFALVVALLTIGRRRRYAVQHLAFALHTYAFLFCLFPVSTYVLLYPFAVVWLKLGGTPRGVDLDAWWSLTVGLIITAYLALALGRAYGLGRVRRTITAAALLCAMFAILEAYRALLFYVTFSSV